jgi:hypothetical protein
MRKAGHGILAGFLLAAAAAGAPSESDEVKAVVQSAYVEGVHAKGDPALMRKGFWADFRMLVLKDGAVQVVTLDEWIGRLEARNKAEPNAGRPAIRAEYPVVNVEGNAAVVRVELYRDGKHVFTDFLSLYKLSDGWKIVGKIFQGHS